MDEFGLRPVIEERLAPNMDVILETVEFVKNGKFEISDSARLEIIKDAAGIYEINSIGYPEYSTMLFYLMQTMSGKEQYKFYELDVLAHGIMGECNMEQLLKRGLLTPAGAAHNRNISGRHWLVYEAFYHCVNHDFESCKKSASRLQKRKARSWTDANFILFGKLFDELCSPNMQIQEVKELTKALSKTAGFRQTLMLGSCWNACVLIAEKRQSGIDW